MFLFKRQGVYYLSYFDESKNREKRISMRTRVKSEAIRFLSDLEKNTKAKPQIHYKLISEFAKEYLESIHIMCSEMYCKTVKVSFNLLLSFIGDVPLNEISYNLMDRFFVETFSRTKQGARTYYIALKSAFNKAINLGYLLENPLSKIKLPRIPKNNPRFINEVELNMILEKEKNPTLKNIYLFAFHTGMRLGEITNLKWNAVDLPGRILKIQNDVRNNNELWI